MFDKCDVFCCISFFAEGHLLTNFEDKQLPVYQTAVELWEKQNPWSKGILSISKVATIPRTGQILPGHCALYLSKSQDMSTFWRVFEGVREGYKMAKKEQQEEKEKAEKQAQEEELLATADSIESLNKEVIDLIGRVIKARFTPA